MQKRLLRFVFVSLLVLPLGIFAESVDTTALTNIASRHHLPMPPKGARLVLAQTDSWSSIYSPAFLLEDKTNRVVVLRGTERQTLEARPNELVWRPFSTADVESEGGEHVVSFDRLSAFVCAVQLAMRGDQSTTQGIWQRFNLSTYWREGGFSEPIAEQLKNPSLLLAQCLFDHLRSQVLTQPTNWTEIHAQMAALFEEFPSLKDPQRDGVFDGLALAIKEKAPMPDSIEALLIDWSRRPSTGHLGLFEEESSEDAPARAIVLRGMDAVPELIALLNDGRITMHEAPAFGNGSAHILSVGWLARFLLTEITGVNSWLPSGKPDAAAFRAWWETCRDKGEEKALADSVFTRKEGKITGVTEAPARILAHKFPDRLPALCEEFSKDATVAAQPFSLAEAVASARLSKEMRVKTLSEFAKRGSLEHKRCVLQNLAELDGRACAQILAPLLDEMPMDSSRPDWTPAEAAFTRVVLLIEDDDIWRKYVKVAKRSSIGLRMEIIDDISCACTGEKSRERRLAFVAAFLDDTALRDMVGDKTKFAGPCAAFKISKITVRDFAAMKIAGILGFKESPDEFWSSAQWEQLRKRVGNNLAVEKLPRFD